LTGCGKFGETTNNHAEYAGLIAGLYRTAAEGYDRMNVCGDSQLIIRQMTGEHSANSERLIPYYRWATELAPNLEVIRYDWIEREKTPRADKLAASAHSPE